MRGSLDTSGIEGDKEKERALIMATVSSYAEDAAGTIIAAVVSGIEPKVVRKSENRRHDREISLGPVRPDN